MTNDILDAATIWKSFVPDQRRRIIMSNSVPEGYTEDDIRAFSCHDYLFRTLEGYDELQCQVKKDIERAILEVGCDPEDVFHFLTTTV